MIFKKIFAAIWHMIDVICFLLAMSLFNYAAFLLGGKPWLCIMAGISFCLIGFGVELISGNQKGGE